MNSAWESLRSQGILIMPHDITFSDSSRERLIGVAEDLISCHMISP